MVYSMHIFTSGLSPASSIRTFTVLPTRPRALARSLVMIEVEEPVSSRHIVKMELVSLNGMNGRRMLGQWPAEERWWLMDTRSEAPWSMR